jgi:aspartate oxidase
MSWPSWRRATWSPAPCIGRTAPAPGAFLDARDAIGAAFPDRFPAVFAACHERRH